MNETVIKEFKNDADAWFEKIDARFEKIDGQFERFNESINKTRIWIIGVLIGGIIVIGTLLGVYATMTFALLK